MGIIIVGGIIEKDGKFLLVQEAKEKCRGKWNIPAGHLDPNETIFEGAKREVFEECGCKVEPSGVLQILSMKEELRAYDWITNAITAFVEKRICNIDIVKVIK